MLLRADRLSEQAGTLCKKAGGKQPYHDASGPVGRSKRICSGLTLADPLADDLGRDIELESETEDD